MKIGAGMTTYIKLARMPEGGGAFLFFFIQH